MKAAIFYNPTQPLKVQDVKEPEISPYEVLVRIGSCGICHGDVQRIDGQIKVRTPMILGHEPAGTVAKVGREVAGFREGDKVVLFAVGCGECYYCKIGKDNVCDKVEQGFGLGRDGCYAEYAKVSPRELFRLPPGIPLEAGSVVTASTGTVFHAIKLANVGPGDTAVIYGAGCLGSQALQLLKFLGARVIVVDIMDEKIELIKKLGADVAINAREKEPVKEIKALTEGRGADVAFEVIGLRQTMLQAIDSVRRGGKIVDVGSVMDPVPLKMMPFVDEGLSMSKELTLMTVKHCSRADMTKLMEVLGMTKIDFESGTMKVPLDEINRGFEIKREGKWTRVLIIP